MYISGELYKLHFDNYASSARSRIVRELSRGELVTVTREQTSMSVFPIWRRNECVRAYVDFLAELSNSKRY